MTPKERYQKLEEHLKAENPVLLDIINNYKELDRVGYRTGLLTKEQTYAAQISWWPLISILGTFSAGKSTFINNYTQRPIQSTGNQAVDDKFSVLCYGGSEDVVTLPGLALDADPRFPFYGISKEIEKVEAGEGRRIDHYLQLKTTNSDVLKGKILIDSPGFDADSQRDSTLRITNHIIDMSDLVLVFFDARHPEPGAMRDTLEHLVATTIERKDADKILYILNQIDTAAREDNPEEIIGAWQRAISSKGLVGGNFFTIYAEEAANDFDTEALSERFKRKKDIDLQAIESRMEKVSIQRTYRIAHRLENIVEDIQLNKIPQIDNALSRWRKKVLLTDGIVFGSLIAIVLYSLNFFGVLSTPLSEWPLVQLMQQSMLFGVGFSIAALITIFVIHGFIRHKFARWDSQKLQKTDPQIANALQHNTRFWRGMFPKNPRGWSRRARNKLQNVVKASKQSIQNLNDQFANPSGSAPAPTSATTTSNFDSVATKAKEAKAVNPETEQDNNLKPSAQDAESEAALKSTAENLTQNNIHESNKSQV